MLVKDLIKHLQENYALDAHIATSIWSTADVKACAPSLTQEQANQVIDSVGMENGAITLEMIEDAIREKFPNAVILDNPDYDDVDGDTDYEGNGGDDQYNDFDRDDSEDGE